MYCFWRNTTTYLPTQNIKEPLSKSMQKMNLPLKKKAVINTEDTKIFCDDFSEDLQCIYFGDTDDESNDSGTFDIDFVHLEF